MYYYFVYYIPLLTNIYNKQYETQYNIHSIKFNKKNDEKVESIYASDKINIIFICKILF